MLKSFLKAKLLRFLKITSTFFRYREVICFQYAQGGSNDFVWVIVMGVEGRERVKTAFPYIYGVWKHVPTPFTVT